MERYSTAFIGNNLQNCADVEDLKEKILPLLQDHRSAWAEKIQQILSEKQTCKQMARLCMVSEPAVRKWRKGSLPQSRDMYIRIGFAAGYDLQEMNSFLRRYGKCPQLYVKSLEDCACMFVLQSDSLEHTYSNYLRVLDMVKREFQGGVDLLDTVYTTRYLSDCFAELRNIEEMIQFAEMNVPSYKDAYAKLYSYILSFLDRNLESEFSAEGDNRKVSFHAMATESRWSSSLRQCISEIRNKRWFPLRHKVISLGLHLNMDTEAINKMLQLAKMEPLYAKNPIEAAIMWAIDEAKLCSENDEIIPDGSSDLCDFVKDILVQLGLDDEGNYLFEDL